MKALDLARARVRTLVRREAASTIAGIGLLVLSGLLGMPLAMLAGLVLIGVARRMLAALGDERSNVFRLELARDAWERELRPIVVVAPPVEEAPVVSSPLRRALVGAAIVSAVAVLVSSIPPAEAAKRRWTFIDDHPGDASWTIEDHAAATGGRALTRDVARPSVFIVTPDEARDVRAMTRCKGDGCGIAFRIAKDGSYVVARFQAGRVEVVRVEERREHVLASAPLPTASPDVWQEIAVEARGDIVRVAVNGVRVIEAVDPTPASVGTVGLWAAASSRAWFDELSVEILFGAPQAIELLPLMETLRRRS